MAQRRMLWRSTGLFTICALLTLEGAVVATDQSSSPPRTSFSARGAPPPRALARRLRASLGPQALPRVPEPPSSRAPTDSFTIAGTIVVGDIDRRTIAAALERLPRRPKRIVMVDSTDATPGVEAHRRDLDAFVPLGSDVIYLRRQSLTVREAELSGGPYVFMLSVVIWHEMAHGEGLDEQQARRREEELWKQFVQRGDVDSGIGMAYLTELRRRK